MRSKLTFDQLKTRFQKLAHEIAIEGVTKLHGDTFVRINDGRITEVSAGKYHIRFYATHLGYTEHSEKGREWIGFDIEEKLYLTSNHCTKISFYSTTHKKTEGPKVKDRYGYEDFPVDQERTDAEKKKRQKKILAFINDLMKGVKPIPRFSLKDYSEVAGIA